MHREEPRAIALSTRVCRVLTLNLGFPTLDSSPSLEDQLSDLARELLAHRTMLWPCSLGPTMDLTVLNKGGSDLEFERSHSDAGHTAVSLRARIPTPNVKPQHLDLPGDPLNAQAPLSEKELVSLCKNGTLND